ncbi:hypothetical protein RhiJN_17300 [Ceratobasidium sp. AG-Ba]|nr:hypothetical protein RhiJN_17300 [Ceratobasidium sp. AG-Ba]
MSSTKAYVNICDACNEDATPEPHPIKALCPEPRNIFAPFEKTWIRSNWMEEFCRLNGKIKVVTAENESLSATKEFTQRMFGYFLATFPWRDPANADNKKYPKDLREKTCWNEEDFNQAPQRMYAFLQKAKPNAAKRAPTASRTHLKTTNDANYLSAHYEPDKSEVEDAIASLRVLLERCSDNWSALAAEDVRELRNDMPQHLENVLNTVARIANMEIVAYGVGLDGDLVKSVSSYRSLEFLRTEKSVDHGERFVHFSLGSIGKPHLGIHCNHPASVVYGDPLRGFLPILPDRNVPELQLSGQLDLYFTAHWRAAGGSGRPPYDLLQEDSISGRYALTDENRYPENSPEKVMMSPYDMAHDLQVTWKQFLNDGDAGRLDPEKRFVFLQASPGVYHMNPLRRPVNGVQMAYPPESHAYAQFNEMQLRGRRDDGLPLCRDSHHYRSFLDGVFERLEALIAPEDDELRYLLAAVDLHDAAVPPHISSNEFNELKEMIPIFGAGYPETDETLEYLELLDDFILPEAVYRAKGGKNNKYALSNLITSCDADMWKHKRSGALYGGPYGLKWPVTLLVVLAHNRALIRDKKLVKGAFQNAKIAPSFSHSASQALDRAASELLEAVKESIELLSSSVEERRPNEPGGPAWLMDPNAEIPEWFVANPVQAMNEWESTDRDPEPPVTAGIRAPIKRRADPGISPPTKRGRGSGRGKRAAQCRQSHHYDDDEELPSDGSTDESKTEGFGSDDDEPAHQERSRRLKKGGIRRVESPMDLDE